MMNERMLEASMIIPICNNAGTIRRTIEAFLGQTVSKEQFELIIIDDASKDNPEKAMADYIANGTVKFIKNESNRGAAYTRNRGLNVARGRLIIFSDGDTIPAPDFVEKHFKFHQTYPAENYAALGGLLSPPEIKVTPLMNLGNAVEGWNSDEAIHQNQSWVNFRTGNFSLKRSFLGDLRFDEKTFSTSGFEDTELGLRLAQKGMQVIFHKQAFSYHYHFRTPQQYINKVLSYGQALARWIKICDPQVAKQLNDTYNYLIDREHLFSSKNIKEIIRRMCINDLTAPALIFLGKIFEKIDEKKSVLFYGKLFKYLFLKGYKQEMASTGGSQKIFLH